MPFIDSRISVKLTEQQKENIKDALGEAVSILHKSETYLMVGINDGYDLFMGGNRLEKGAYVEVSLFGSASSADYNRMTGAICDILDRELGIPGDKVYVTYHGISDWGWNGSDF